MCRHVPSVKQSRLMSNHPLNTLNLNNKTKKNTSLQKHAGFVRFACECKFPHAACAARSQSICTVAYFCNFQCPHQHQQSVRAHRANVRRSFFLHVYYATHKLVIRVLSAARRVVTCVVSHDAGGKIQRFLLLNARYRLIVRKFGTTREFLFDLV